MLIEAFHVGETVYYKDIGLGRFVATHGPGPFRVRETQPVPPEKIFYDPVIGGGVGHTQYVFIDGYEHAISGAWFTREKPDHLK